MGTLKEFIEIINANDNFTNRERKFLIRSVKTTIEHCKYEPDYDKVFYESQYDPIIKIKSYVHGSFHYLFSDRKESTKEKLDLYSNNPDLVVENIVESLLEGKYIFSDEKHGRSGILDIIEKGLIPYKELPNKLMHRFDELPPYKDADTVCLQRANLYIFLDDSNKYSLDMHEYGFSPYTIAIFYQSTPEQKMGPQHLNGTNVKKLEKENMAAIGFYNFPSLIGEASEKITDLIFDRMITSEDVYKKMNEKLKEKGHDIPIIKYNHSWF